MFQHSRVMEENRLPKRGFASSKLRNDANVVLAAFRRAMRGYDRDAWPCGESVGSMIRLAQCERMSV